MSIRIVPMQKDSSRLRVAIADPSHFGQTVLADLLMDEGVREIVKFSDGRDLVSALRTDTFDLVLVDDDFPRFSASELMALAQFNPQGAPQFIALQSILTREDVGFLRERGIGGVLLKPVAPKRFSALFRSLFRVKNTASLAA